MTTLYFSYGSNMRSSRLVKRVGDVRVVGAAALEGYHHRFNKHGSDETAKGNIVVGESTLVRGALYELSDVQLTTLDRYEGGYQRLWIEVARGGQAVRALTYEAVRLSDTLRPTPDYLGHYVAGCREHGLPEHYLRGVLPRWFDY